MNEPTDIAWPRPPPRELGDHGAYFVTVSTNRKQDFFEGAVRLGVLHGGLLKVMMKFGWQLEAWAVFSNHYHFVVQPPFSIGSAAQLREMLRLLHERTGHWVNELDSSPSRKVWLDPRSILLTEAGPYRAHLCCTHRNAVKHSLVKTPAKYPWCSAAWFEDQAPPELVKAVYALKKEKLRVTDDFDVADDW